MAMLIEQIMSRERSSRESHDARCWQWHEVNVMTRDLTDEVPGKFCLASA